MMQESSLHRQLCNGHTSALFARCIKALCILGESGRVTQLADHSSKKLCSLVRLSVVHFSGLALRIAQDIN